VRGATVLIAIANGPEDCARNCGAASRYSRPAPAGGRDHRAAETELGWEVTHVYGLTETAVHIDLRALPEHAQLCSADRATLKADRGRAHHLGRATGVDETCRTCARCDDAGEIVARAMW